MAETNENCLCKISLISQGRDTLSLLSSMTKQIIYYRNGPFFLQLLTSSSSPAAFSSSTASFLAVPSSSSFLPQSPSDPPPAPPYEDSPPAFAHAQQPSLHTQPPGNTPSNQFPSSLHTDVPSSSSPSDTAVLASELDLYPFPKTNPPSHITIVPTNPATANSPPVLSDTYFPASLAPPTEYFPLFLDKDSHSSTIPSQPNVAFTVLYSPAASASSKGASFPQVSY